jgi:hypothetical protein
MIGIFGRTCSSGPARDTACADRSLVMALVLFSLIAAMPATTGAQVHHLQDIPWHVVGGESRRLGVELTWVQYREPRYRWHADRVGIGFYIPLGGRGCFFLREDYMRFDTAGRSVFDRWPMARSADLEEPDPGDSDWPYESIINGFGRPEIGLVLPLNVPLLGHGHLGMRGGLPIGTNRLYPLSAGCLPLSADWRASRRISGFLEAAARIGYERTFASSGDELHESAFPQGWRYGFEIGTRVDRSRGVSISWSARELEGGRHLRRLALGGWLPLGQGHKVRLLAVRDLGDPVHRLSTWTVGLTWHLAPFQPADEQNESSVGQIASMGTAAADP